MFTLLYPFRQGFYARQGYAPVAPARVIEVSPRAIPAEWAAAARGTVRPLRGDDRPGILEVYGETARLGTGFLERPTEAWGKDLLDEQRQWLVFEQAGVVAGYASLSLHQRESHARVSAEVHELVAPTEAARRRLLAALAALGDQVSELTLTLAEDDPLPWALVDADRNRAGTLAVEHALGVLSLGPMIRLHDARAALLARGYEEDGALVFAIDDAAPFTLEVRGGRAEVAGDSGAMPVAMSKASLASVAFGGLPLASAARLGWTTSTSPAVIRKAGNLLRLPPFFSLDAF